MKKRVINDQRFAVSDGGLHWEDGREFRPLITSH
jgi:hypothetical protein